MKNVNKQNPSSVDFGRSIHTPSKVLREAKLKNRELRRMKNVYHARKNPDKYSIELGVCWMCWLDLTSEMLEKWRIEPFSEMRSHEKVCPLCGYPHWKGRIWYPFRYIRGYIGNPSSRYGMEKEKR